MHDPLVLAWSIRRPWPRRANYGSRRWEWPELIAVWHVEPGGADALRGACKGTRWRWHIHHFRRFSVRPWQRFKLLHLTRCAWCGGKSAPGDYVNFSNGGDERCHSDCLSIRAAHRACTCGVGPWESSLSGDQYGTCAACGKYRVWDSTTGASPRRATDALLATIPPGQRDPAKTAQVVEWWADWRETERALRDAAEDA